MVASDGGIFNYGDAGFYGSMGGQPLNAPDRRHRRDAGRQWATGRWRPTAGSSASATPTSTAPGAARPLNRPIVGMAADATGHGYWLVASRRGDLQLRRRGVPRLGRHPSPSNRPVVGMAATADGGGYWLVASRRRDLQLRRRRLPGLHGRPAPGRAGRGHGGHARRRRVLAGRLRRWRLQLRRRRLLRLHGWPARSTHRSWAGRPSSERGPGSAGPGRRRPVRPSGARSRPGR